MFQESRKPGTIRFYRSQNIWLICRCSGKRRNVIIDSRSREYFDFVNGLLSTIVVR